MSPIQVQILWALHFLTTSYGILSIAAFFLMLFVSLIVPQTKMLLLALAIIASTLTLETIGYDRPLVFPLQQMRQQGRTLTLSLIILLLFNLLRAPQGTRHKYVVGATIWFFIYEITMALRLMFSGDFSRGGPEMLIFMLLFLTLAMALSRSLNSWEDIIGLVRTLACAGIIFAFMNVYQFAAHPSSTLHNRRFLGTTNNPQHAAAWGASLMLPVLYLLIRPGRSRFSRSVLVVVSAMLLVIVLWTASRTGLLMMFVGVGLLFRTRLSRIAAAGLIGGILVMLFINLSAQITDNTILYGRLFSSEDTRSGVWHVLIQQFVNNPIVGIIPAGGISVGENSYLSTAARFGCVGLIPLAIFLALIGAAMLRLQRISKWLPDKMLADLVIAGIAQLFIGAFFEGYLLGTLVVEPILLYCYLTAMAFLLEYASLPQLDEQALMEFLPENGELVHGVF